MWPPQFFFFLVNLPKPSTNTEDPTTYQQCPPEMLPCYATMMENNYVLPSHCCVFDTIMYICAVLPSHSLRVGSFPKAILLDLHQNMNSRCISNVSLYWIPVLKWNSVLDIWNDTIEPKNIFMISIWETIKLQHYHLQPHYTFDSPHHHKSIQDGHNVHLRHHYIV